MSELPRRVKDSIDTVKYLEGLPPVVRFIVIAILIIGGPLWLMLGLVSIPYIILVGTLSALGGTVVNRREAVRRDKEWKGGVQKSTITKASRLSIGLDSNRNYVNVREHFVKPYLALSSGFSWEEGEQRTPYQMMEHAREQQGVIIWGLAGTGKSTLAQWLACEIAGSNEPENWSFLMRQCEDTRRYPEWIQRLIVALRLDSDDKTKCFPVPILVRLRPGSGVKSIERLLYGHIPSFKYKNLRSPKKLGNWLQRGMVIPIFDGLDELPEETRAAFLRALVDFCNRLGGNRPFVLTTRSPDIGLPSDMAVSKWRILPFNEVQIRQYARLYFSRNGGSRSDYSNTAGDRFWEAIQKAADITPRFWDIVSDPMLLAMLATIFTGPLKEQIPKSRAAVYEMYVRELCKRRCMDRYPHLDITGIMDNLLAPLAYESIDYQSGVLHERDTPYREVLDALEGVVLYIDPEGSFSFGHQMLEVYFASRFFCERLHNGRESERRTLWEQAIKNGCVDSENNDNSQCFRSMNWRELLALAVSTLMNEPDTAWVVQDVDWCLHRFEEPSFQVLLLRLISIVREQQELSLQGVEALRWLKNFYPVPPAWWRDVWEASYTLDVSDWERLEKEAHQLLHRQDTVRFLGSLRHEKAAEILVNLALNRAKETGTVPDEVRKAVHRSGMAAVSPLVESFGEVDDEACKQALIELMGEAGYARSTNKILQEVVNNDRGSETLRAAAFHAWAKWGSDGTHQLRQYLIGVEELPPYLQRALIEALTTLVMDRSFAETKIIALLSDKSDQKRALAIRLIQAKLDARTDDVQIFAQYLETGLSKYKPRSLKHRVLGYLEKKRLGKKGGSPRRDGGRTGSLYGWLAPLGGPSPEFVKIALQIDAEVGEEPCTTLIEKALYDHCLSIRTTAVDALARRCLHFAKGEPLQWLPLMAPNLPQDALRQAKERLRELQKAD